MKVKKFKNKKKPFKIIFEPSNAPDAEERFFKAMSILLPEKDILAALSKKDKSINDPVLPQEPKN